MSLLIKPEPFSHASSIASSTRLFDAAAAAQRWVPAMDLAEAEDHFVLKADLPGPVRGGRLDRGRGRHAHHLRRAQGRARAARAGLAPHRALVRALQPLADAAGGRRPRRASSAEFDTRRARRPDPEARGASSRAGSRSAASNGKAPAVEGTAEREVAHRYASGRSAGRPSRIDARDGSARAGVLRLRARRGAHAGLRAARLERQRARAGRRRGRRAGLRDGAGQHLPPVHRRPGTSTSPRWAACTSSWAGGGRSSPTRAASRCSRWATARWPRRSSAAAATARVADPLDRGGGRALPLLHRRRPSGSWAPRPRWRCRPRWARTSRWPSTSARPSTSTATTRARSMERTHRWLDRCVAWHGEHGPDGQAALRDRAGRGGRGPARRVGGLRRRRRRRRASRSAARSGEEKEQMREVLGLVAARPARRAAAAPARDRRRGRHPARGGRGDRHLRLRHAHPPGPPRHGAGARSRAAAGGST